MSDLRITKAPTVAERRAALSLRHEVFVREQGTPPDPEHDEDDAAAHHVVILRGERAIATGRIRTDVDAPGVAKAERIAVARDLRRTGLGRRVMRELELTAEQYAQCTIKLASQLSASRFYEQLGYEVRGEPFLQVGIEHIWMEKKVARPLPDEPHA